jgi:hypothetical protein
MNIFIDMGKYIITETQLKNTIYSVLDSKFVGITDHVFDYEIDYMYIKYINIGRESIKYVFYKKDDDGNPKGIVSINRKFGLGISKVFKIRLSKVIDIIGDYVEEVHGFQVDDAEARPEGF